MNWSVRSDYEQEINKEDGSVNLIDYKVTSVWAVIFGKIEWERQLNCYAWLFRQKKENIGKSVGSLKICAILRDWNRRDARKIFSCTTVRLIIYFQICMFYFLRIRTRVTH